MQFDASTPRKEITIQDAKFSIAMPFYEGHTLTKGEASQMNQLLTENVRNNLAGKAKARAEKNEAPLTQAEVDAYVTEYEFGERKAGSGEARLTPVEREAKRIATGVIEAKLKERGVDVTKERKAELVVQLMAKDHIVREAEKRVKAVNKISTDELGLDDLLNEQPQQEAA